MMNDKTLTMITRSLKEGSAPNAGLTSRLRKYKRDERKVTANWLGRDLSKAQDDYAEDAKKLGDSWISLCVDLATLHGEHMSRKKVAELGSLIEDSIKDSLGLLDHDSPIIVGFLPGQ